MKKFLLLVLVLILAGCGSQAGETVYWEERAAYLEEQVAALETERYQLVASVADLQATIAQMEGLVFPGGFTREEVIASFMDNLPAVAEFLGLDELYVPEEDIGLYGRLVTVRCSQGRVGGVTLTFTYRVSGGGISWRLIGYGIHAVGGPGFLDAGRSLWRWEQERLFDENFTMRFYRHSEFSPEPIYGYTSVEIEYEDWQAQVIYHMQTHTDIRLADLWYEGNRLVVDLTPWGAVPFNWGSHGSAMRGLNLTTSLATLPNVEEIEVLVGGQRGFSVDHFYFGTFRVD